MSRTCAAAVLITFLFSAGVQSSPLEPVEEIAERYIAAWKVFYPSVAHSQGFLSSLTGVEDFSVESIQGWVGFNKTTLTALEGSSADLSHDSRIDARLLARQIRSEIEKWEQDRPHVNDLGLYATPIAESGRRVADSDLLSPDEKTAALLRQFVQIEALCSAAEGTLENGRPDATGRAMGELEEAALFYERELPEVSLGWIDGEALQSFVARSKQTSSAIRALAEDLRHDLLPRLALSDEPILGHDDYARKLAIYTDSGLTPERLETMALEEIHRTKELIRKLATRYWDETYADQEAPRDPDELVARALSDLEDDRPRGEQEYLATLKRYAQGAEDFVRENEIVTLPPEKTLSIVLAPESAGPMARIGYVSVPPPFHPNPWTTWYLATIPDSHPEQEREDFWRSFNYPFKKFIVIHELFPGHYLQLKTLRENLHPVRILFLYDPFTEGWATLCEEVALEAGYAEGEWLTLLAQLRKRLENANRAYTSVQAHCNGWSEERVFRFSVETSLLAPQFAKSLWGRLMESPMQMITYMLGSLELSEIYQAEKIRLGEEFRTKDFMDTLIRTGPVPSDEYPAILKRHRR
jgi:hypothetical protein